MGHECGLQHGGRLPEASTYHTQINTQTYTQTQKGGETADCRWLPQRFPGVMYSPTVNVKVQYQAFLHTLPSSLSVQPIFFSSASIFSPGLRTRKYSAVYPNVESAHNPIKITESTQPNSSLQLKYGLALRTDGKATRSSGAGVYNGVAKYGQSALSAVSTTCRSVLPPPTRAPQQTASTSATHTNTNTATTATTATATTSTF